MTDLRTYETMYIIRPNLDEEGVDRTINSIEELIKSQGGELLSTDKRGRKRLAYEVKKMRDGYYVNSLFKATPDTIPVMKRMMTLSEDVIRQLIISLPKEALEAAPVA